MDGSRRGGDVGRASRPDCFIVVVLVTLHHRCGRPWLVLALPNLHGAGGLGLRSTERTSPGAYWAAWADALPMIAARTPSLAARFTHELTRSTFAPHSFTSHAHEM